MSEPFVDHIHCTGVRNAQDRCQIVPFNNDKVTMHKGDLVFPNLGLSDDDAEAVFNATDAVIHNDADMSYLKTYTSLRPANLQSTKDLVKLIAQHGGARRKVPFHYVSTVSVGNIVATARANGAANITNATSDDVNSSPSGLNVQETGDPSGYVFYPVSVATCPPPTAVSTSEIARMAHGYVATKSASEVFLEHLHERYPEWPIVIHRPSLVTRQPFPKGPSSSSSSSSHPSHEEADTGTGRLELVENLRKNSSLLRAVRDARGAMIDKRVSISGTMNIVSLPDVVKGMVDSLKNSLLLSSSITDGQEGGKMTWVNDRVKFIHHIGDVEIPMNDEYFRVLAAMDDELNDVNEGGDEEDEEDEEKANSRNATVHEMNAIE